MKKLLGHAVPIAAFALPIAALAASGGIKDFIATLTDIINTLIPFLAAVATLVFIFGVIKYITAGGDEKKTSEARSFIIYGLIGLAIIVAVWGLVNIILNSFQLDKKPPTDFPKF